MRKSTGLAGFALAFAACGFVGTASAADVNTEGGGVKDEPVAAFAPVWAGLYVGASVGYSWGDISDKLTLALDPPSAGIGSVREGSDELNSAVYGAHLGYNFQHGNFVFGPEISLSGTGADAAVFEFELSGNPIKHDLNWYASAVGRLGYAHNNVLFYGFGGVAWSKVQTEFPVTSNLSGDDTTMFVGWSAGAGVELALNNRLSIRAEYAHFDLGREKNFDSRTPVTPNVDIIVTNETEVKFDVVKIGASYRFGGGDEALR